ncbi:MAG: hypothetical protein K2X38_20140 [Gemmataceae bacterium]|nr:hypothetical protein [Gemmataceae bacterium]
MITNDAELTIVRRQLALMEDNLQSLRQRIDPATHQRNYLLYAQGLFDMIRSLRRDIDAYVLLDREFIHTGGFASEVTEDGTSFLLRDRDDGKPDINCNLSNPTSAKVVEGARVVVRGTVRHSPTLVVESLEAPAAEPVAAH